MSPLIFNHYRILFHNVILLDVYLVLANEYVLDLFTLLSVDVKHNFDLFLNIIRKWKIGNNFIPCCIGSYTFPRGLSYRQ